MRQVYRLALCVVSVLALAPLVHAADQMILGKLELVRDPKPGVDASKRKLLGQALEKASTNTIVGDPTLNGATLTFFAFGATSSNQAFVLPAARWRAAGTTGFTFKDSTGAAGAVKVAQIRASAKGTFQIKATVGAKFHPITVVPPNPGTSGCILFEINGGDRYHVLLGPSSLAKKNDAKEFQIRDATSEGLCPLPTTTTSTTTSSSVTTTSVTTTTLTLVAGDWYVDGATGSDTNSGTSASPFKSITRALGIAGPGSNIFVAPGTYDASNGEVFPLDLHGVALIGDEAGKGLGTIIAGTNGDSIDISIRMFTNASLAGFTVALAGPVLCPLDVVIVGDDVTVRNNTLSNVVGTDCLGSGLYFAGTAHGGAVTGNVVSGNGVGIAFVNSAGVGTRFETNVITANTYGVEFDVPGGDFGGGASGSVGGNVISCNGNADVSAQGPIQIDAAQNFWDHNPPTQGTAVFGGVDIRAVGAGVVVNVTGSQVAASPCP